MPQKANIKMSFFAGEKAKQAALARLTQPNAAPLELLEPAGAGDPAPPHDATIFDLDQTDEMPVLRESAVNQISVPSAPVSGPPAEAESDVFVSRRNTPEPSADEAAAAAAAAAASVTLFIYGWENVEPGPLSWVFPSLRAALEAVRTLRNANGWSICAGSNWDDIEDAREKGAVLVEQNA
jgi:hypothetical protein